jgi:glycosyltransferase involved in cell wall biosynthesis
MVGRTRILSVIDDLGFGGDENRLLAFATSIDRERFEHEVVTLAAPHPSRVESWAMHQHYEAAGIRPWSLGEVPPASRTMTGGLRHYADATIRLLRKVVKLRRLIGAWRPVVVDAHLELAGLVSVLAAATSRTPTVVTLYNALPRERPPLWWVMRWLVIRMASVIVTDSDVRRRDIVRQWRRSADSRVVVIPNGISPPITTRPPEDVRGLLGIPPDRRVRVVGQVASLVAHKGHLDLLNAARAVLEAHPSTVFLLVGFPKDDLRYKDEVERRIRELGLVQNIRLVSYPGPIGDVWSVVDVQVHASTSDSLPNALIEGMSLGKPIVATTVGGVPDMLEHMRSAVLVPPHDPVALASALRRVLEDPELATRLGTAARQRYLASHQTGIMARALETCFDVAAERARAPRTDLALYGSPR